MTALEETMNMQIKNKKPKKTHTNANKGKKKKTQKKMSENKAYTKSRRTLKEMLAKYGTQRKEVRNGEITDSYDYRKS